MKATLHWDGSMWRLELPNFHTGYEQQVEICSTYVINFDDMMQCNMSTRRGRPVRREVPADPVVDGTWEWQDTDSSWNAYHPSACGQIALARRAGRQGTLLYAGRGKYWVDLSRSVQINMSTRNERPIRHRAGGQSWREVALDTWRTIHELLWAEAAEKAAAPTSSPMSSMGGGAGLVDGPHHGAAGLVNTGRMGGAGVEVLDEDTQLALALSLSEAEFRQGGGRQGGGRGGGHRADLPRRPPVVALDAFVEYEA
jgi:hypothetical protein